MGFMNNENIDIVGYRYDGDSICSDCADEDELYEILEDAGFITSRNIEEEGSFTCCRCNSCINN